MSRRTVQDYTVVFREQPKLLEDSFPLEDCVLDFKMAIWISLTEAFSNVTLHGCLFYFLRAFFRRVQHLGLTKEYKEETETRQQVKKIVALPFLPHRRMVQTFENIIATIENWSSQEQMKQLMRYVDQTWFKSPIWRPLDICAFKPATM